MGIRGRIGPGRDAGIGGKPFANLLAPFVVRGAGKPGAAFASMLFTHNIQVSFLVFALGTTFVKQTVDTILKNPKYAENTLILITPGGPLWMDFEAASLGPREWDATGAPRCWPSGWMPVMISATIPTPIAA